jgi:hypothetical protein
MLAPHVITSPLFLSATAVSPRKAMLGATAAGATTGGVWAPAVTVLTMATIASTVGASVRVNTTGSPFETPCYCPP